MMKLALVLLLAISSAVCAQDFNIDDYSYNYSGSNKSLSKQQLFSHLRVSLAEMFESYKEAVDMEDTLSGVIILHPTYEVAIGQGMSLQKMEGIVRYKLKVIVKNGAYSIKISDFVHSSIRQDVAESSGGNLADDKPDCGWSKLSKKGWNTIRDKAKKESDNIIRHIAKDMASL